MNRPHNKIEKLLIANRGEIALRIQRAAHKLSIKTVSIASEADKDSYFAREAEELVVIGAAAVQESYLNISKIIQVALNTGCNAVHPGYGFLSENPQFAQAVLDAGLIFVGPSPEAIRLLGSKTEARSKAIAAGVTCLPGAQGGLSDQDLVVVAEGIGYPVLIKAVGGGGGRGMRVARSAAELAQVLPRARAEGLKNFGSGDVFIERYIEHPRHVEVQLFGDMQGRIIHFGTRDCSTQRRHQKLVEEAPAPNLSPELRAEIEAAAVRAAAAVGYYNAGTAEFLVKDDAFYFLEMNTRIQVEHPVTEIVTGTDLVQLQLLVAEGAPLPVTQEQVTFTGHAIEFRIYAEDPAKGFAPSIGNITGINRVTGPDIREDYGFESGDTITPYYDAMMSKLIISGPTRAAVVKRSLEVLRKYSVQGVSNNITFFRWLLMLSPFRNGPVDIGYIEREFSPAALRDLLASEVRDPQHRSPVCGAVYTEHFDYHSSRFNQRYTVQVKHLEDGLFEAAVVAPQGQKARRCHSRLSNGRNTALSAVTKDVLEKVPAAELFEQL
jgi:acetyl/propionyl-CoA carboxylase alpha subunit